MKGNEDMTAVVIRLHWARVASPAEAMARACTPLELWSPNDSDILWQELALVVRNRLQLPNGVDDETVIESLQEIAAAGDKDDRWAAAFGSNLGVYLSLGVEGFEGAMHELLSILPPMAA